MNSIIIMGRMTADPDLKTTTGGTDITTFTVAVDRPFAKNGEKQTDFIKCVAWRERAAFVNKWFRKGQMIAVQGTLQSREYTNVRNEKKTVWEVIAEKISFCGDKKESEQTKPATVDVAVDDDDLPW